MRRHDVDENNDMQSYGLTLRNK